MIDKFIGLFQGLDTAFGTGKGGWCKRPPTTNDFSRHLQGLGTGIGIAPLRADGTVLFAAIDLDEPDFAAAGEMQTYIPGASWVERSRSGNAHVWVFFNDPIEAWVVRGILKEAIIAADKRAVEIFPKQDKLLEGMVGNYINLPYFGNSRKVLGLDEVSDFAAQAWSTRNNPEDWRKRARWLMIAPPERRTNTSEFGSRTDLHMCAEWIIANRDSNPIVEGTRNAVYFALAKQLSNYEGFDHDEAWSLIKLVNNSSTDPAPEADLLRILRNAETGRFTSTGCDDPLVAPYCHPDCPIAKGA